MRMSSDILPRRATHFSDGTALICHPCPTSWPRCAASGLLKTRNQLIVRSYEWSTHDHVTTALRRTAEKRNKMVRQPLPPTEKTVKLALFRIIAPLDEKLTTYLAKKSLFATPGPRKLGGDEGVSSERSRAER
jgi:hypothetical protein